MFIDCHVHALETPSCPNPRDGKALISTPEELLEIYDRVGIEKGVILNLNEVYKFMTLTSYQLQ